jgi:HK97 family phage prohead protease
MARLSSHSAIERRYVPLDRMEVRSDGKRWAILNGHASVFNKETIIYGMYREEVAPGAFAKTIKESDIRALWNHNPEIVLGRNKAGTLSLSEDDKGLAVEISPPENEWGRPVVEAIKRQDVSQMSIGFRIVKQEWDRPLDDTEMPKRRILEAKLYDVSPVTFPAYEQTDIAARSADGAEGHADVLHRARVLLHCADEGMRLSGRDYSILREAQALLEGFLSMQTEPEQDHHSPTGEPEMRHHSAEIDTEPDAANHSAEATPDAVALVPGSRDKLRQRLAALENRISGGAV